MKKTSLYYIYIYFYFYFLRVFFPSGVHFHSFKYFTRTDPFSSIGVKIKAEQKKIPKKHIRPELFQCCISRKQTKKKGGTHLVAPIIFWATFKMTTYNR